MVSFQPRADDPNPNFHRDDIALLTGEWQFAFDDQDVGVREHWEDPSRKEFSLDITVPFCYQSELSGIFDTSFHDVVWYRREIHVPPLMRDRYSRVFAVFGAVDYECTVFLNGHQVGQHAGGMTPFAVDLTPHLREEDNVLALRVWDPSTDTALPRGKQYWKPEREGIFYERVTGLWQPAWLEGRNETWVEALHMVPQLDPPHVTVHIDLAGPGATLPGTTVEVGVYFLKNLVGSATIEVPGTPAPHLAIPVDLASLEENAARWAYGYRWTPETPNLIDVVVTVHAPNGDARGGDTRPVDEVTSYFGLREVSIVDGQVCLNGTPVYQKLLLHQYYWPRGLYTAPNDEDFQRDIALVQNMGFNGVRVHQAVADPRFLYWCDRQGLLVWGEYANAMDYSPASRERFLAEWPAVVRRDVNHPAIITWTPFNESWGIKPVAQRSDVRAFVRGVYHLTKSLDPTRPVNDNDGWEHVQTDLCTAHLYVENSFLANLFPVALEEFDEEDFNHIPMTRALYVGPARRQGEPILFSEVGGWALDLDHVDRDKDRKGGWGYGEMRRAPDDLERDLSAFAREMARRPWIQGFCYTEFCDVFQEMNGLVTFDRRPKIPPGDVRAIFEPLGQERER